MSNEKSAMKAAVEMRKLGGSFVHGLGELYQLADGFNKRVLRRAFSNYFKTYGHNEDHADATDKVEWKGIASSRIESIKELLVASMDDKLLISRAVMMEPLHDETIHYIDEVMPSFYYENKSDDTLYNIHLYKFDSSNGGFFHAFSISDKVNFTIHATQLNSIPMDTLAKFFDTKPYKQ